MMRFEGFTERAQDAANRSVAIMWRYGHNRLDTAHLLLALLEQPNGFASRALGKLNVDVNLMCTKLKDVLGKLPKHPVSDGDQGQLLITPDLTRVLSLSQEEANRTRDEYISTEHLFLAINAERKPPIAGLMIESGLTRSRVEAVIKLFRAEELVVGYSIESGLKIFLCHASNDKPAVRELYQRLRTDGFEPWLDEEDILPGQHWQVEIPRAVRNSDIVLVCLSQHSISKAGYVQKEIKFALDVADEQPEGTIFLIPLRLEECDVPERLNHLQWVNFYDEGGYARLLRALRRRAADLNAAAPASVTTTAPSPSEPGSSEGLAAKVSGGVSVDANNVTVGNDVVGRDKITQTTINIQNATIIQAGASVQDIKPAVDAPPIVNVVPPPDKVMLPGEIWLSDRNNHRTIGGMEFVRVPAGKFLMGSQDDNELADNDERPQHVVEIPYDYWIGRYPVTNEQFARFVETSAYKSSLEKNWNKKSDHPVVNVSWHDAMAYCQWLDRTLRDEVKDLMLRLPTEAEWEKAARGTQGNEWPWSNEFDKNKCNSSEGRKRATTPVGAYSPHGDSPYGAADMVGNVWEWCHSLYKPYPYQAMDEREGKKESGFRVLRGGAFHDLFRDPERCASRHWNPPNYRNWNYGFRLVVAPVLS